MAERGRPTAYDPMYAIEAEKLCRMFGATDLDLAEYFNVSAKTIYNWKHSNEDFLLALKSKRLADERVVRSLFERATGYSHPEEKVFNNNGEELIVETVKHYPPDTGACVVWLGNRLPGEWKKDPSGSDSSSTDALVNALSKVIESLPN